MSINHIKPCSDGKVCTVTKVDDHKGKIDRLPNYHDCSPTLGNPEPISSRKDYAYERGDYVFQPSNKKAFISCLVNTVTSA